MIKVHTKRQTGNYVRLFISFLFLSAITISCEDNILTDDPRDNIVDTWKCQETGSISGVTNYLVEITKSLSDSTKILIEKFYGLGDGKTVEAKMNGLVLTIPRQSVGGFEIISGSGKISSNYKTISWTYKVDDGSGEIDNVTATYSKAQ